MRTDCSPDTTTIEPLDFEATCSVENPECPVSAVWMVVAACGHSFLLCEDHWVKLTTQMRFSYTCSVCPKPGPLWFSFGEAVVNSWRIT